MSATLRADDPRARETVGMGMLIVPLQDDAGNKFSRATLSVLWADGRHWSGSCDGKTCHEAATGCMALAREEGAE